MLDAFEYLVTTSGERTATFDAVAAEAGVSKGGLLYHFPSREALVDGLVERLEALIDADVTAMTSAADGAVDYFIRTSSPDAVADDDPFDRCITAVTNLASSGRWPRAVEALSAMQRRWYDVVLDEVGDPVVARLVCLVADGLWFTPGPFDQATVDPAAARAPIGDVIGLLQGLARRSV
ncbi:hypothetical protein ASF82_07975 [Frigoribacterium sp. Leaf164]|nr:hypothetical protein ASF82_07975 [Frigoribacterium sp. Leaf164]